MKLIHEDSGNRVYEKKHGVCSECGKKEATRLYRMLDPEGRVIDSYEMCKDHDESATETQP